MLTETITWRPIADGLPDAELTVLIACDTKFHSEPVWIGFHDGEAWREANGEPAFVTHWAPMLPGPDDARMHEQNGGSVQPYVQAGAPGATDAERAAWLADKIVAHGDYAKEAAAMLRHWPAGSADDSAWVAQVVSSGPHNFQLLQWRSADVSLSTPIGTKLYAAAGVAVPGTVREFLEHWSHEGHLQTFEDRERFRKAARELLAPGVMAGATDHVARELATVQPPWPKERRVGRREDMSVDGKLHVMLQEDGDVCVQVVKGATSPNMSDFQQADIEFCVPGSGGGRSPRTREALVALMVAIEADNAAHPIPASGVAPSLKDEAARLAYDASKDPASGVDLPLEGRDA